MATFDFAAVRAWGRGPIVTTGPALNHEGAGGSRRDTRSELFLLAVAGMSAFYETADARAARFTGLIHRAAVEDHRWTGAFLGWLRRDGDMRSTSIAGAAEATRALLDAGLPGGRQIVGSVLQRADEPGELLAYWTARYGRSVPKPVKRGIADAVQRLYTEYSLLKYDTAAKGYRFADVIDLVHPVAASAAQGDLFRFALDRRHDRPFAPAPSLPMIARNAGLRAAAAGDPSVLLDPGALRAAGLTWEDALSLAGHSRAMASGCAVPAAAG